MSPDYFVNFLYNIFDFFDTKKSLKFEISKKFLKNNNTRILKILISPRGDKESPVDKILFNRLYKKGYPCLYYYVPSSVLSPNISETVSNFNIINSKVRLDVSRLKSEHNFERIDIISSSLGVVSACLIANNNKDINNIFLFVPGSCLASSLWEGIRTQGLRKMYEKQNIKLEQLKNLWKELAPKNNIGGLSDKNIFIAISKKDKVIPYVFGKEFADLLKTLYPNNTTIRENKNLGHYFTVIKYYLFSKVLLI